MRENSTQMSTYACAVHGSSALPVAGLPQLPRVARLRAARETAWDPFDLEHCCSGCYPPMLSLSGLSIRTRCRAPVYRSSNGADLVGAALVEERVHPLSSPELASLLFGGHGRDRQSAAFVPCSEGYPPGRHEHCPQRLPNSPRTRAVLTAAPRRSRHKRKLHSEGVEAFGGETGRSQTWPGPERIGTV